MHSCFSPPHSPSLSGRHSLPGAGVAEHREAICARIGGPNFGRVRRTASVGEAIHFCRCGAFPSERLLRINSVQRIGVHDHAHRIHQCLECSLVFVPVLLREKCGSTAWSSFGRTTFLRRVLERAACTLPDTMRPKDWATSNRGSSQTGVTSSLLRHVAVISQRARSGA